MHPRPRRHPLLVTAFFCCLALAASDHGAAAASPHDTWQLARRFAGSVPIGELGFRFGEPLDVDGDGVADVAAGARFKLWRGNQQNGTAAVWSGATGTLIREWDGEWPDALFGHWVMPVPDLSHDGLADLVIAAPHARSADSMGGIVVARSPKTGDEIWSHVEADRSCENLGWDVTLAGDDDHDGFTDLLVGAPGGDSGRVYLLSGKDGTTLRSYAPPAPASSFGWYLALVDDLDGDRHPDFAVGAPFATNAEGTIVGAAFVLSSRSGTELRHWTGSDRRGGFGNVVAAVADIDGDGKRDIAVTAPGTEDPTRGIPGEITVYSSATGKPLRHLEGKQPGEQYGRMVVATDDLDRDGVADLAIGAPWYRRGADDRVGRVELRSGRTGALLAELFGESPDDWFGWHIVRAPDPARRNRPALLISSLRHRIDDHPGVGVVDLYVLNRTGTASKRSRAGGRKSRDRSGK